jgi:hypothetical protein
MGIPARRPGRPYAGGRGAPPIRPRNARYPAPSADRLRPHRRKRRDAIPLPVRVLLAGALLALGAATTAAASGLLGGAVSDLGGTVVRVFGAQLNASSPSPSAAAAPAAPRLVASGSGWTNQSDYTVHGFVPLGLGDQQGYTVRIYINGEEAAEQLLTGTQDFTIIVAIPVGPSAITATIVGPTGEGAESDPIHVTYDDAPPPLKISSPKKNATIKSDTVQVKGTTQAASTVTVRNESNGGRASAVADDAGAFALEVTIVGGPNTLDITAVDPAGNTASATLPIVGGGGKATVRISLTNTDFKLSKLPAAIGATVRVLGPDGQPVSGAVAVFTVTIPGVAPVQSPPIAAADGTANFNTQIPSGASAGTGLVTVVITTDAYGTLTATAAFKIS